MTWAEHNGKDMAPSIVQLLLFLTLIIIIIGAHWCCETLLFSAKALFLSQLQSITIIIIIIF